MRKKGILFFLVACFIAIGCANGASRSISNQSTHTERAASSTPARATTTKVTRTKNQNTVSRTAKTKKTSARTATTPTSGTRTTRARIASWLTPIKRVISRATTNSDTSTVTPNPGFGIEYTNCRDAYFTCMDQFCAGADETYRRCICSSRLNEIKQKQSTLAHTADSLQGFNDLNIDVINKSTEEVRAMMAATDGEQAATNTKDNSDSDQTLSAIGDVLSKSRTKALSTAGTLDAGGDIKAIWSTTDLANGVNIANLTGEKLFNAVNAQCSAMVAEQCTPTVLNMVISAYGMYIENDCAALATDLNKKKNTANSTIRETNRNMHVARLENYDAHNSLPINDCIAKIRQDLTNETACGPDFVHCWDVTGLYLTIDKGEPIYSAKFYNLENQISLSGNILNNKTNSVIVAALNNKKMFAEKTLDKCRDLSSSVWDEFMRQAIIEIHQKQQEKIRDVKTACLGVVNECYDDQTQQLKQFNDNADKTLLGLTMETVEDLCKVKMDTCSNLYGGGPDGLAELVNTMHNTVNQKIVAECQNFLTDFAKDLCAVQSTDTLHGYPYGCRVYEPGGNKSHEVHPENDNNITLYQRFVNYAMQVCIRPSEYESLDEVPPLVLQDVNIAIDKTHIAMNQELSKECERLDGIWVSNPYPENSNIALHDAFYTETGASKNWGYCREPNAAAQTYTITFDNGDNSSVVHTAVVTYGEIMPNISVPSNGCEFGGYYTQPNGAGIRYYDENGNATRYFDMYSDVTLYAYFLNQHVDVPSATNALTGCTFAGYYSESGGQGTQYYDANGDLVSGQTCPSATLELEPKWVCPINYFCVPSANVTQACPSAPFSTIPTEYTVGTNTTIPVVSATNFQGWKIMPVNNNTIAPRAVTIPDTATGPQRIAGYYCSCI